MKPKLLFVYDHKYPDMWMDGLWSGLNVLEEDFKITKWNKTIDIGFDWGDNEYKFILGWGAFNSSVDRTLQRGFPFMEKAKKGLCVAGNATTPAGADNYDILFYETDWIKNNYLKGVKTPLKKAFGVNTDIFMEPTEPYPILWDYIGVGAYAKWKRWYKFNDKQGSKLVVGEYQKDNEQESLPIVQELMQHNCMVSGQVHPFDLCRYYYMSRTLYMPSDVYGGGERSVLEARACGLNIEIEPDNPKLKELVECEIPTHHDYAKALKEGILSVL